MPRHPLLLSENLHLPHQLHRSPPYRSISPPRRRNANNSDRTVLAPASDNHGSHPVDLPRLARERRSHHASPTSALPAPLFTTTAPTASHPAITHLKEELRLREGESCNVAISHCIVNRSYNSSNIQNCSKIKKMLYLNINIFRFLYKFGLYM